jgi:PAS domain S-box-containing protein
MHPLKVLYAESHLPDIENTRRHFAVHADHLHLDTVSTGPEALLALQPQDGSPRYDVLLMNFHLPELNALEVLRELRLTHQQKVPVVLVCREGEEELARQGLKLGASSYLVKSPGYLYQLPWQLEEAQSQADLLRREAALRASEARNRAILNAIPDLMFLLNRDGVYLDYHAKDPGQLLMPPEQLLGKNVVDVMPPQLAADFSQRFKQASDKPATLEYKLSVPEGTRFFEASIVNCNGDKILVMVRDITERKEAEESLKKALTELQQLKDRLHEENIYLQEEIRVASNFGEIIGRSQALRRVLRQAEQVAPTNTTILLLGETGTGKELLAHAIHNLSPRHKHPLVKVNCTTLPAPLIESELFGHEKGAFTGASAQRHGRFELADGGTIFLDEVGELPLELQAKLLRVLEEGEFERVGSNRTVRVDVRVIAATNRNLAEAVRKGTFRSDLYYRLSIFPITLPPLRDRQEDIPILVTHFVKQLSLKLGKEIETVPQNAMAVLQGYPWPGNIRELRNVIERAVIITQGSKLQLSDSVESQSLGAGPHLPGIPFDSQPTQDNATETLEQSEYNLILRTLKQVYWKIEGPGGAAELLKIHPSTLRTRMKKLGLTKPKIQAAAISR